jgi:alkylation response protein AidB-like acyl-CoA dehydrogenase
MSAVIGSKKINFSEEQGMLLDVAREFVKDKSPGSEVRKFLESEQGFSEPVWQELVDLGWTGINLPESVGGSGLGIAALIPVVESMGKGLMGTPLVSTVLAAELIRRAGGIAEEDILEDISGGCAATVAYLDRSDWGAVNTGVSVDAQGVLSGSKFMVPDAAQATWIAVVGANEAGEPVVALVSGDDIAVQAPGSSRTYRFNQACCNDRLYGHQGSASVEWRQNRRGNKGLSAHWCAVNGR